MERNNLERSLLSSFAGRPECWHPARWQQAEASAVSQLPAVRTSVCSMHSCLLGAQLSAGAQLSTGHAALHMAHSCLHGAQPAGCPDAHMARSSPHGAPLLQGAHLVQTEHLARVVQPSHPSLGCTSGSGHTAVCSCRIPVASFLPKQIHLNAV